MYISIPPNSNIAPLVRKTPYINVKIYKNNFLNKQFKSPQIINEYEILDFKKSDVTGDGYKDYVYLIGKPVKDSFFKKDIKVFIEDGRNKRVYYIDDMKENGGYEPRLFLGDFTENGVNDILVSIASGGSGGFYFYYIFEFKDGQFINIFDNSKFNNVEYSVNYLDNYKVEINDKKLNEKYIIDISNKGTEYLNELYYDNGKLKKTIEGYVTELNTLFPIYSLFGEKDKDKLDLFVIQRIIGTSNADNLGYIESYLIFKDGKFIIQWKQIGSNFIR